METSKLRLGIVGCQGIGVHMARAAVENAGIDLLACCDVSEENARRIVDQYQIPHLFVDYDAMLDAGVVDSVYLATPHYLHDNMVRKAVLHDLPVLCEKPITESAVTARQLVAWVQERKVKVGINYQRRYDRNLSELITAVRQGCIGGIRYARINVPWLRDWDYFSSSGWHRSMAKAGGGTFITQASHYLDIVLQALLPDTVADVMGVVDRLKFPGQIEVEDFGMGILRTHQGRYIELCSSMVAQPQQPVKIELYGENGTLIFDDSNDALEWLGENVKILPPVRNMGTDSMAASLEAFRAWVCEDVPYRIPIESALPVLECIHGLYHSSLKGCFQSVPAD